MHVCGVMACLGFPPIYHVTLSIAISKYARNSRHNVIFHGHVARCRSQNLGNKSNIFMKITSDSPPVPTLERMQPQKGFQALWSISQKCQRSMGIEEASSYLNSFPIYHHTSVGRPKTTSDRRLFHIICLKPLIARLPRRLIWSHSSKLGPQAQIGRISLDPLFLNLGTDYNNSSRLHLNRETGFECKTRTRPKTC